MAKEITILGIESSCDETAAAVVVNGTGVKSSVVASQIELHRKYGGVVPEIASRAHIENIQPIIAEALEKAGELKRLMETASMDITPEWLNGYLAAISIAPKLIAPSGWINGLLERKHGFSGHDELQRFLDLVLLRYNAANADMADLAVTGAGIRAHDEPGLRRWAEGFTESVARHKGEWTARTVTGEDKRVLRFIADAASGRAGASELKPLLPAWLTHRREARR